MKKVFVSMVALLLVASVGMNAGISLAEGNTASAENEMTTSAGDSISDVTMEEQSEDVPTWNIGTSWSYSQETWIDGDEDEELPRIKWMELEEELIYTVEEIEYVEVDGTMTPVYNVTLEGDITGGEGVLETDAAGDVHITIRDDPSTVHGYILHRMDDLGVLVDYEYRYMEFDADHWAVYDLNVWQVNTDTHEPNVEDYDFPLTPGGDFWANNTVHTEGYNRVYVEHALGSEDETEDVDDTFNHTRQVSVSERGDSISVPGGDFETYNVTKDADFVNVNDDEDEGEVFRIRDYNETVQNYVKEDMYRRRVNNETEWIRELEDYHIPEDNNSLSIEPANAFVGEDVTINGSFPDNAEEDFNVSIPMAGIEESVETDEWGNFTLEMEVPYVEDNTPAPGTVGSLGVIAQNESAEEPYQVATLTILDPKIEPEQETISAGENVRYKFVGYDSAGNELRNVTADTNWSDDVDPVGESYWVDDELTVNKTGDWTITGEYEEIKVNASLTVEPGEAVDFWIEPEEETVIEGEQQEYTAMAEDEQGNVFEVTNDTEWSDDVDPEEASYWYDNEITVTEAGNWTITGEYEGFTDNATLNVTAAEIEEFWIDPEEKTIVAGETLEYTAMAKNEQGYEFEVTEETNWSDDVDPEEDSYWDYNEITVNKTGNWTITGEYDDFEDNVTLNITVADAVDFWIEPEEETIAVGQSQNYTAYAEDEFGHEFEVTNDTEWSDDVDPEEASSWDDNEITVTEDGIWEITGEYENETGTILTNTSILNVDPADIEEFWIEPENETVYVGEPIEYTAMARNEHDDEFEVTQETNWSDDVDPEESSYWDHSEVIVTQDGNWTVTGEYDGFEANATLNVTAAEIEEYWIEPEEETMVAGGSQGYTALAENEHGHEFEVTRETNWSDDVDPEETSYWVENEITVNITGEWTIIGEYDGMEGTATLTVEPAGVYIVEIDPKEDQIVEAGDDFIFTASAYDEHYNLITDDGDDFTWENASEGIFNEVMVGDYEVNASYDGVDSVTVNVTVEPADADHLKITPENTTVTAGVSQAYNATTHDRYGNNIEDVTDKTTWSDDVEPGEESFWMENEITVTEAGNWTITGAYNGLEAQATLNVEPADIVGFWIEPEEETIAAGESQSYTAMAENEYDHEFEVTPKTTWSDDVDPEEASYWEDNEITVTQHGNWTVTGEYKGFEYNATLNVTAAEIEQFWIEPEEETIAAGGSLEYTAMARNEYDHEFEVTRETNWSDDVSPEEDSLWVDNEITVNTTGEWTITGEYGEFENDTTLIVDPGEAVDFWIESEEENITAGESQNYTAYAVDDYGHEFEVTGETNWSDDVDPEEDSYWEDNEITVNKTGEWIIVGKYNGFEDDTTLNVTAAEVDTVQIDPDEDQTAEAGENLTFTASAHDGYGNLITDEPTEFTWQNADDGIFNEEMAGDYEVNATYNGVDSVTINVTVEPADPDHIRISPGDSTITAGESQAYNATVYDRYGNEIEDVTDETNWSDDVDSEEDSQWVENEITVNKTGTWNITGIYDEMENTTTLTVEPTKVSTVDIDPDEAQTVEAGEDLPFAAFAYDEYGNLITDDPADFTWQNAEDGVFNEETVGDYEVKATYDGVDSVTVTVTVEPADADYIEISPQDSIIRAGEVQPYTAVAYDRYGNEIEDVTDETIWSDDVEPEEESYWSENELTVNKTGTWNVTGTYDEIEDTVTLSVELADISVVEIDPEEDQTVKAGEDLPFAAFAYDEYGNLITDDPADFTWQNADDGVFNEETVGDYEVKATYEEVDSVTVTVTVEPADAENIEITPSESTISVEETQTYTATAYDEYGNEFDVTEKTDWSIDEEAGGSWTDNEYTSENAGEWTVSGEYEDLTDTAILVVESVEYELTIDIEGEGTTEPEEGTHVYEDGEEVTVEATPAEGWQFVEWAGDETGTETTIEVTMDEDKNITAVFEVEPLEEYELEIDIDGEGTTEPEEGNHTFDEGEEVTVEAMPADGWVFVEWTGDETGTDTTIEVMMDADKSITAVFEEEEPPEEYDLMIEIEGEGTTEPEEGNHTFDEGEEVTIEATPSEGWQFVEWTGDETGTETTIEVTMDEEKSITAVFEEEPPEAEFEVTNFNVELDDLEATITADVENIGDAEGSIALLVDGEEVTSVTVQAGETETLDYTHEFEEEGTYNIEFGEQSETVTAEEEEDELPIMMIVGIVVIIVIILAIIGYMMMSGEEEEIEEDLMEDEFEDEFEDEYGEEEEL